MEATARTFRYLDPKDPGPENRSQRSEINERLGCKPWKSRCWAPCCWRAVAAMTKDELRRWMSDLRATTKPRVTPLTEPKQFHPQDYTGDGNMEPFSPQKLTQALRRESSETVADASLIAPRWPGAGRWRPTRSIP